MSKQQWYCLTVDQRQGPFTVSELKALAVSGELQPLDLLWRPGAVAWVQLSWLRLFEFAPSCLSNAPLSADSCSPPLLSPDSHSVQPAQPECLLPHPDGVCFCDGTGRLYPTTTVWRLDSEALARCEGLARQRVPRSGLAAGRIVGVRLVALE